MQGSQLQIATLSGISIILFMLSVGRIPGTYDIPNFWMVGSMMMVASLAAIVAAFALSVKKGSYITGAVLAAMGIFQVYDGYSSLEILQNPAIMGGWMFVQNYTASIIIGLVMIGMAALTILRKRRSSVNPVEKKPSATL